MTQKHLIPTRKLANQRNQNTRGDRNNRAQNRKRLSSYDNKLVKKADKIISLLIKIQKGGGYDDSEKLHKHLRQELDNFQHSLHTLGYDKESILISRYALTVSLDEAIFTTAWGQAIGWENNPLLQKAPQKTSADENFFIILERLCENPIAFIDVIELMYICLSLGFKGKFRNLLSEKNLLQEFIDNTYYIIRTCRGEFDKRLSPSMPYKKTSSAKHKRFFIPISTILILTLLILCGAYFSFGYFIKLFSNQLTQTLQTITTNINTTEN